MQFDIITLFPQLFEQFLKFGVCGRAFDDEKASARFWHLRDYAPLPHRIVDDRPYGGGSGMVLSAPPLLAAMRDVREKAPTAQAIYLTPRGELFDDSIARELASSSGVIFLCGRYRGVDERAVQQFGGRELSIGDYVLSGGELAALVIMEAVLRHIPGVLGCDNSAEEDAFSDGLLDAPSYTRPPIVEGVGVPDILLSGDHAAIAAWRKQTAEDLTAKCRPDLLDKRKLRKR